MIDRGLDMDACCGVASRLTALPHASSMFTFTRPVLSHNSMSLKSSFNENQSLIGMQRFLHFSIC
jgi:hypothetical protein